MSDELSPKEMGFAEQQWAALQQDDLLLAGLRNKLSEQGIQPVEVPYEETPPPTAALHRQASVQSRAQAQAEAPSTYEHAILAIMDIREMLIENFRKFALQKDLAPSLVTCIRKCEESIRNLGGSTESFNPLASLSGLSAPVEGDSEQAMLANALKVAENTKTNYKLYDIPQMIAKISKSGSPSVLIQVAGTDGGKPFVVNGQIIAKSDFSGNEAIDYVRDGDQQAFIVKAVRLGKWVDISDEYTIRFKDMPVPAK